MNSNKINELRVLTIAPCVQGIGFIVFNGPRLPIDWGVKWIRHDKNAKGLTKVAALIERYQPDVVVLEDHLDKGSRRAKRIEDLLDAIAALARRANIETARYSRSHARRPFATAGAATKFEIAQAISAALPELAPRLPAKRKIWLPEHANMSIFDAASLALAHFTAIAQQSASDGERAA